MKRSTKKILAFPSRIALRAIYHQPRVLAATVSRILRTEGGIVQSMKGERRFESDVMAVFVIWQKREIPWYVENALEALRHAKVNVMLVSNCEVSPSNLQKLRQLCHTLLVRDNTGADFGGYRDASLLIATEHQPQRIIYLNDSIFYFKDGLSNFIDRLAHSESDLCAAFESWEVKQHIQSFAFSISSRLFKSAEYQNFWLSYLPVNSRRWAIRHGEIGLSKVLLRNSETVEIIFNPVKLREHLQSVPLSAIPSLNNYLPIPLRMSREALRSRSSIVVEDILTRLTVASPIHSGGFLYHRYLNCPIIKRDLVYRMQFGIYDVEQCLDHSNESSYVESVLSEMRRRGTGSQLPLFKRLLFMDGLI